MGKIRKGDIVGRISYGKDILFTVERIIKTSEQKEIAILKGILVRIKADSPVEDLEIIDKRVVEKSKQKFENRINELLKKCINNIGYEKETKRVKKILYTGKILHLDGDKRYSEKSNKYYKKMGLNVVVKNISENRQPRLIKYLLQKYRPDILVITGHDGMIRNGTDYQNLYNYRNSSYFIKSVKEARESEYGRKKFSYFCRCVPKFL